MSFRVGGRTRLASAATPLSPKCLIVATSISLASFFSPVSASASLTGQAIEEVVSSAGSTVAAATDGAPSLPPTSVPSVPTPTPPANIPVPSQRGERQIPLPPASHVPNPPNSVGSVRTESVQVGDGSGNVVSGVGTQTPRPSLSLIPLGHHPRRQKGTSSAREGTTARRGKGVDQDWSESGFTAMDCSCLAGRRLMGQYKPENTTGGRRGFTYAGFFGIPRAFLPSMGLAFPGDAPRVGSVPVRSETPMGRSCRPRPSLPHRTGP